jgi:hypothetical protein
MRPALPAAAILLLAALPSPAHRLDEYLQGTIISVEKHRVNLQMALTPGVAVFPSLIEQIDTDADGVISSVEQQAYAERVVRDVSLKLDGRVLAPRLLSVEFPPIEEMKEGRGEIRIELHADLPSGGPNRKLIFENHHQSRIAAYLVNCLVPQDPGIRIVAQNRNYSQSFYELEFVLSGPWPQPLSLAWTPILGNPLASISLLLVVWVALLWRRPPAL